MTHFFIYLFLMAIIFALGALFGAFVARKNPTQTDTVLTDAQKAAAAAQKLAQK